MDAWAEVRKRESKHIGQEKVVSGVRKDLTSRVPPKMAPPKSQTAPCTTCRVFRKSIQRHPKYSLKMCTLSLRKLLSERGLWKWRFRYEIGSLDGEPEGKYRRYQRVVPKGKGRKWKYSTWSTQRGQPTTSQRRADHHRHLLIWFWIQLPFKVP